MKILLSFLFLLLSSELISATYYDRLLARGSENHWPRLLHFDQNYFLPSGSRIDTEDFFFHPDGHEDEEKELNATIDAFVSGEPLVGDKKLHPQCAFPERRRYLIEAKIEKIKEVVCPEFDKWQEELYPVGMSLIYISPSVNNVKDYLGDVFLKLRTKSGEEYAIYFQMVNDTKDYYVLGPFKKIFGQNKVRIQLTPLKKFLKERRDIKTSDLYEYDLLLDYPQMQSLVYHLWEIKNLDLFNYYLINENLVYFLAGFLSVARDDWNFLDGHYAYYTPRDLIRQINQIEDSVFGTYHNPSLKKQIDVSYQSLSRKEKSLFKEVDKENIELRLVTNTNVLDTLILKGKFTGKREAFYKSVEKRRDEINSDSIKREYSKVSSPEKAHLDSMMSISANLQEDHPLTEISFTPFHHSLMSREEGFEPGNGLSFFHFNFAYDFKVKKYKVPEFTFFEFESKYIITHYNFGLSQKYALKKDYVEDIDLAFKSRVKAYYGVGLSYDFLGLFSLYSGMEFQRSAYTKKRVRLGPWVEWNLLFRVFKKGKILLRQKFFTSFLESISEGYYLDNELRISFPSGRNINYFLNSKAVTKSGSLDMGQYKLSLGYERHF